MPCKNPILPDLKLVNAGSVQHERDNIQDCALLCESRRCRRGGVCSKHWSTLFKKQLLPVLISPEPTVNPLGQEVSTEAEKRPVPFFPAGEDGDGGTGSWCSV